MGESYLEADITPYRNYRTPLTDLRDFDEFVKRTRDEMRKIGHSTHHTNIKTNVSEKCTNAI